MDDQDRFDSKWVFDPVDGCHLWTASYDYHGYGRFSLNGRAIGAHRAAWILMGLPVTPGLDLDHLCRNTGCVNVAHLEEVTRGENLGRGDMKNGKRLDLTKCAAGLHHWIPSNIKHNKCWPCHLQRESDRYYNRLQAERSSES